MDVLAWITGVILILGFAAAGLAKILRQSAMVQAAGHFGFPVPLFQLIGVAEVAGAIGVLIGLLGVEWLGIVAAAGLVIVGLGAVFFHLRAGDPPPAYAPAGLLTVVAILYIIALASR